MSTKDEPKAKLSKSKPKKAKPETSKKPPPPLPAGCESLLGKAQICTALGISLRTFQGMLVAGEYPKADIRLGAFPRWRIATHNAWIESKVGKSTKEF
jgi:predicted DNA-binding transcriptional regulator AlpA